MSALLIPFRDNAPITRFRGAFCPCCRCRGGRRYRPSSRRKWPKTDCGIGRCFQTPPACCLWMKLYPVCVRRWCTSSVCVRARVCAYVGLVCMCLCRVRAHPVCSFQVCRLRPVFVARVQAALRCGNVCCVVCTRVSA